MHSNLLTILAVLKQIIFVICQKQAFMYFSIENNLDVSENTKTTNELNTYTATDKVSCLSECSSNQTCFIAVYKQNEAINCYLYNYSTNTTFLKSQDSNVYSKLRKFLFTKR